MRVPPVRGPNLLIRGLGQVLRPPAVGGVAYHKAAAELHKRKVGSGLAPGQKDGGQTAGGQVCLRPFNVIRKDKERGIGVRCLDGGDGAGIVRRGADLQDGILRLLVIAAPQVYTDRPDGGAQLGRIRPRRGRFAAQLGFYNIGNIGKIALALEIAPCQKIPGVSPPYRRVAVGGKVQAQRVEQRCGGSLKAVPVPRQQAAALLVFDHQRLGGVLPGQMRLGKARVGQNFHRGADVQRPQRTDCVGGRTVPPVLPVQQGHALAAAQAQRPGKGVDEHLVAEPPGQLCVDHGCPPSLS